MGGWVVGRWVGSMVGGWVILGLNLVQLKLEIQLGQNFGNKKIGRVNPGGVDTPPCPQKILGLKFCWVVLSFCVCAKS